MITFGLVEQGTAPTPTTPTTPRIPFPSRTFVPSLPYYVAQTRPTERVPSTYAPTTTTPTPGGGGLPTALAPTNGGATPPAAVPSPAPGVTTTTTMPPANGSVEKLVYPAGTIHYFDAKIGMYRVAVPYNPALGQATQTYVEGTATEDPATKGSTPVTEDEYNTRTGHTTPIWKKWWFWALIVGGIAIVGGTVYFIRKKKAG